MCNTEYTHVCVTDGHQRVGSHWPSVGALSGHQRYHLLMKGTETCHAVLSELLHWKRMAHCWGECEIPHIGRTDSSTLSLTSGGGWWTC